MDSGDSYYFGGFHGGDGPEVAGEDSDPEEGGFLCEVGEGCFDVVGGLVFALCDDKHLECLEVA